ncbi:hypothetical protein [Lactococcus allomyrinae]|uniref:Uncharacterized protein n=1 Tax=Lactococcus allomyrinae TaxID=2419773 RepID=A0A387BFP0_9LACT|nr:hypothetical protein [Lactococcus allomyrinae]AYF99729.1 hypothetical protein D7I46_00680 [Lactococcus allomyrinae]
MVWIEILGSWLLFMGAVLQAFIEFSEGDKKNLLRVRGWTIVSWGAWFVAISGTWSGVAALHFGFWIWLLVIAILSVLTIGGVVTLLSRHELYGKKKK